MVLQESLVFLLFCLLCVVVSIAVPATICKLGEMILWYAIRNGGFGNDSGKKANPNR